MRDLSEPSASPAIDDESWSVLESPSVVRLTAAPARSIPSRSLTELLIDGARFEQKRSRGAGGLSTWQMPSSNQRLRYRITSSMVSCSQRSRYQADLSVAYMNHRNHVYSHECVPSAEAAPRRAQYRIFSSLFLKPSPPHSTSLCNSWRRERWKNRG